MIECSEIHEPNRYQYDTYLVNAGKPAKNPQKKTLFIILNSGSEIKPAKAKIRVGNWDQGLVLLVSSELQHVIFGI